MVGVVSPTADRDLERRVKIFLHDRHVPGLRHVAIAARDGVVTLSGRVTTFYEKQLAQQCTQRVAGVVQLVDCLTVS